MKKWVNIIFVLAILVLFSGCAAGVSGNGYVRDESPAFSVNESHGVDYYQMYGY